MSHEHKVAIEKIAGLCLKSTQPTYRLLRIFDIALSAQGLTLNQRIETIEGRLQGPMVGKYVDQLKRDKQRSRERKNVRSY